MRNKKVTYHNNHLMYINQDHMFKRTLWQRCKHSLTMIILKTMLLVMFIIMAYCIYTVKYL